VKLVSSKALSNWNQIMNAHPPAQQLTQKISIQINKTLTERFHAITDGVNPDSEMFKSAKSDWQRSINAVSDAMVFQAQVVNSASMNIYPIHK